MIGRSLCFSSMSNSLSSMAAAGSCLQQREHSSYPYMFHDPLHSLSSTYNHSAARAAVSNPAVAHSQSAINTHAPYGGVTTSSTPATGTGKSRIRFTWVSVVLGRVAAEINPTSVKSRKFRPLQSLLYLTARDICWLSMSTRVKEHFGAVLQCSYFAL